jgi:carbamoyl-phosphate synthase large subunit
LARAPLTLDDDIKEEIRGSTRKIAQSLAIKGPFNIQYLVKNGEIYVIECNMRASRSMPYVSKSIGRNLMKYAAGVILGEGVPNGEGALKKFCVKVPQFSFMRLDGADPVTGVEMVSTGEVAGFSDEFNDAFVKALTASGLRFPRNGDHIMMSIGGEKSKGVENRKLKLIINTPSPEKIELQAITDGYLIRRKAVECDIPIITNIELADRLADALQNYNY